MANPTGKPIFARFLNVIRNWIFSVHNWHMRNKWYINALIFALVIVGINLKQVTVPNQEIALQFADTDVTLNDTQSTITLVKSQLEALDVYNIKIQDFGNGTLKITYYSEIAVSEIKEILLGEQRLTITHTAQDADEEDSKPPSDKDVKSYQLDVYEIQETHDVADSNGTILESNAESIRFLTPDSSASINKQLSKSRNKAEKLAYTTYRNIAVAIDDSSYNIPEVRAGPTAYRNS